MGGPRGGTDRTPPDNLSTASVTMALSGDSAGQGLFSLVHLDRTRMADDVPTTPDLSAAAAAILAKHGGEATRALAALIDENHDYRAKNRDLRKQLDGAKVPEGARVLTADDAKAYDAYVALGTPTAVAAKLEQATAATGELATLKHERAISEAADAHGLKAPVLRRLSRDPDAGFEVVEVKQEQDGGQPVKVAYVRKAGDANAPTVKLSAYVATHFAEFGDALTIAATGTNAGTAGGSNGAHGARTIPFPSQAGTGAPHPPGRTPDQLREDKRRSGAYAL